MKGGGSGCWEVGGGERVLGGWAGGRINFIVSGGRNSWKEWRNFGFSIEWGAGGGC